MKIHFAWAAFACFAVAAQLAQGVGPPADSAPANKQEDLRKLNVAYAQAKLQLAEWDLARMEKTNQRFAKDVTQMDLDQLRTNVKVARERLDFALNNDKLFDFESWVRAAGTESNNSARLWRANVEMLDDLPRTIRDLQVPWSRMHADIWSEHFERGRALIDRPQIEQLAWRINTLLDQFEQTSATNTVRWWN